MKITAFDKVLADSKQFLGATSEFDIGLLHFFLGHQEESQIRGNLLEFGVYQGRTAAVLCHHLQDSESIYLIDHTRSYSEEFLERFKEKSIRLFRCPSEDFPRTVENYSNLLGKFRLVHLDGSYLFSKVINDLQVADQLLHPAGLIVVGNFLNSYYPQISAATYRYIYSQKKWHVRIRHPRQSPLKIFLIGEGKAILCRSAFFDFYRSFTLKALPKRLESAGQTPFYGKTDKHEDLDVIYAREKTGTDQSRIYGEKLYGHLFNT